jgi:hypothetical protein
MLGISRLIVPEMLVEVEADAFITHDTFVRALAG